MTDERVSPGVSREVEHPGVRIALRAILATAGERAHWSEADLDVWVRQLEMARGLGVPPLAPAPDPLQQFVAYVGEGHVAFPRNLTELADAVALFKCAEEDTRDVR